MLEQQTEQAKKPPFTAVLRQTLATIMGPEAEFTGKDLHKILSFKGALPNGRNAHARIAQSLTYLEATGHIQKTHTGRLGKRDPHKWRVTEKCLSQ